jgi:hypothetical protein
MGGAANEIGAEMANKISFIKIHAPNPPYFGACNSPARAIVDFRVWLQDGIARRK